MTTRPSPSATHADLLEAEEVLTDPKIETPSANPFAWFMQKGYPQGAFWAIMITLVSVTNDILMRLLGAGLDIIQISF